QRPEAQSPVRLALGRLGVAADRGRDRGRLPPRARGSRRSGRAPRRDRGAPECGPFPVSHGRAFRGRGDHRSPRHATDPLRLGRAGPRARPLRVARTAQAAWPSALIVFGYAATPNRFEGGFDGARLSAQAGGTMRADAEYLITVARLPE